MTTTRYWVCAAGVLGVSALAAGGVVNAGWDLLQTHSGTHFMGVPLQGVPLGMHDFGGPIGQRNVGFARTRRRLPVALGRCGLRSAPAR